MTAENICCSQLYLTSQIRIFPIAGIQLISDEWMKLLLKPTSTGFHVPPTGHSLCYQGCPFRILYKELRGKTLGKICKREKEYIYIYVCVCMYVCIYSEDHYLYTHTHTHTHTCTHIYRQKSFLNYIHIPTHIHTHRSSRLTKTFSGIAVWKYKL